MSEWRILQLKGSGRGARWSSCEYRLCQSSQHLDFLICRMALRIIVRITENQSKASVYNSLISIASVSGPGLTSRVFQSFFPSLMSYCLKIGCYPAWGREHIPHSSYIPLLQQPGSERVSQELTCLQSRQSVTGVQKDTGDQGGDQACLVPHWAPGPAQGLTLSRHIIGWTMNPTGWGWRSKYRQGLKTRTPNSGP